MRQTRDHRPAAISPDQASVRVRELSAVDAPSVLKFASTVRDSATALSAATRLSAEYTWHPSRSPCAPEPTLLAVRWPIKPESRQPIGGATAYRLLTGMTQRRAPALMPAQLAYPLGPEEPCHVFLPRLLILAWLPPNGAEHGACAAAPWTTIVSNARRDRAICISDVLPPEKTAKFVESGRPRTWSKSARASRTPQESDQLENAPRSVAGKN